VGGDDAAQHVPGRQAPLDRAAAPLDARPSLSPTLSGYPFGIPDAANEAPARSAFVVVDALPDEPGAMRSEIDDDVRVVVGRIGAGKTRCLVEIRERLKGMDDFTLLPIEHDLPSSTYVTRLAEDLEDEPVERREIWRKLWRCAIVRAALSHLLHRVPRDDDALNALAERVGEIGPGLVSPSAVPHSIYADFSAILRDNQALAQLRRFLDDPRWDEIEFHFTSTLEARPSRLCFFLDTGEEDSSHAPRYWLRCQLGLVRQVLQFAHNAATADKLRIYIAIRDQTWAELAGGRPGLAQHPRVLELRWGPRSAAGFLAGKIAQLDEELLMASPVRGDAQGLVAAWLGVEEMHGGNGGAREPITIYLLRHTRLIPRDIVIVGNLLALEVRTAQARGETEVPLACIHNAVAESARLSAREELQACSLEVIARRLAGAGHAERRSIVPDEDAASRTLETIKDLLATCGKDVVECRAVEAVDEAAGRRFETRFSLSELLWRRGLIGWSDDPAGPFSFCVGQAPARLRPQPYAALHPCLVDELALEPAAEQPVVPFPQEELA
jgi:hypothetical protein